MHVHGHRLNVNALLEVNTGNRSTASQRTADVRRKLLRGGDEPADEMAFEEIAEDRRSKEKDSGGEPGRRRKGSDFRAANESEDEGTGERTSFWA